MNDRVCVVCGISVPDANQYSRLDRRIDTVIGGRTLHALVCSPRCESAWCAKTPREQLETIFGNWRRGASLLRRRWGKPDQPADTQFLLPTTIEIPLKPLTDFEKRIGIETCPTPESPDFPWKGCPDCKLVSVSWVARPHVEQGAGQ